MSSIDKDMERLGKSGFNKNIIEAEKEYQEALRAKNRTSTVETGGVSSSHSFGYYSISDSDKNMNQQNSSSNTLQDGGSGDSGNNRTSYHSNSFRSKNESMVQTYRPIEYTSNSILNKNSTDAKTIENVFDGKSKVKIIDLSEASRKKMLEYQIDRRLSSQGIRTVHTVGHMITGIARSAVRNDEIGRGLTEVADNGGEVILNNKMETIKAVVTVKAVAGNSGLLVGLAVVNSAKRTIRKSIQNSYFNKYYQKEYTNALKKVNDVLSKHGIENVKDLNSATLKEMINNIKQSSLTGEAQKEAIKALKNAGNWSVNLDTRNALVEVNKVLKANNLSQLHLEGSELAIAAKAELKKAIKAGASEDVIEAYKKAVDIGNAQTFDKSFAKKFKKKAKFIKGIGRSLLRYLRQTDAGRGASMVMSIVSITNRTIKKAVKTVQNIAKIASTLSRKALLASLKRKQKDLSKVNKKINKMINNGNSVPKKYLDRRNKLSKKIDKKNIKRDKLKEKANKKFNKKNQQFDPFGLKARFSAFRKNLREKTLRKILGDRLYEKLGIFSDKFINFFNGLKKILRKIVAIGFGIILLFVIIISIVTVILSFIGSFDLSGDSNYKKAIEYVCELYKDDIKFISQTGQFQQADYEYVTGLGCTNIIFNNGTYISKDKYDMGIGEEADEDFNHNASSNIAEILSMTYIHFEQELGKGTDTDAVDIFNDVKYKELRSYMTQLWRGSHKFVVTYVGDEVNKVEYITYYFDDIFSCEMRNDRWIEEIHYSTTGDSSTTYAIWKKLLELGYSEYAAAGILGCWEQESRYDPFIIEYKKTKPSDSDINSWVSSKQTLSNYTQYNLEKTTDGYFVEKDSEGNLFYACGVGLAQWTGPRAWDLLYYYNAETDSLDTSGDSLNEDWKTLDFQMKFLTYEMTNKYASSLGHYKEINATSDSEEDINEAIRQATHDFLLNYEYGSKKPDSGDAWDKEFEPRYESAKAIYKRYTGIGGYVAFIQRNYHRDAKGNALLPPILKYQIYKENEDGIEYTGPYPWDNQLGVNCAMCTMASIVCAATGEFVTPREVCAVQVGPDTSPEEVTNETDVSIYNPDNIANAYGLTYLGDNPHATPDEICNYINNGCYIAMYVVTATPKFNDGSTVAPGDLHTHWIALLSVVDEDEHIVLCSTSSWGRSCFRELDLDTLRNEDVKYNKIFSIN